MKKADASGAPLALIVGDDETAANAVSVKTLRRLDEETEKPQAEQVAQGFEQERSPAQMRVNFDELADHMSELLFTREDDNGNF
jgi:histidyl-tRNA synthetase